MPKAFQTWTTLKHDPIEKHGDNLWSVKGTMPNPNVSRRMVVARLGNGGLVIHNAIALDDASMKELEAFGEPAYLLVPNTFHRQDSFIYKQRYPKLRVFCPRSATKGVSSVVPVDGSFDDLPADPRVKLFHLRGMKEREGALFVQSDTGSSATFCDIIMNIEPRGGLMGFALAPTGRPAIPRVSRWFIMKDRKELCAHLEELASASNLKTLLVGHGQNITEDAPGVLKSLSSELLS